MCVFCCQFGCPKETGQLTKHILFVHGKILKIINEMLPLVSNWRNISMIVHLSLN
jgi:hypothetical protein